MIKYLIISPQLLKTNLSWMEKILLSLLGLYTRAGIKNTTASDKYLAEEINVSSIYVNRTLAKLKDKGLIEINKDLGRRAIELADGKKYIYSFGNKKNKLRIDSNNKKKV